MKRRPTSDTRQRTREAAAQLVAGGKRPHEITVDLIYVEIQQGSRTTINDELKLWKDERTKIDALGADLPPPVADAMRAAWLAAVEHGEQVFEQRREALEQQVATAQTEKSEMEAARLVAEERVRELGLRIEVAERRAVELEQRLAAEVESRNAAQSKSLELTEQLAGVRGDHARELERRRQEQAQAEATHQQTLADREATFRNEMVRATERLEGVQNHMLMQISEARDAQKRAETELQATRRRGERLQSELTELRMQHALQARNLHEQVQVTDAKAAEARTVTEQKDSLQAELAEARGQLQALNGQLAGFEKRALTAETRLSKVLDEQAREQQRRESAAATKSKRTPG